MARSARRSDLGSNLSLSDLKFAGPPVAAAVLAALSGCAAAPQAVHAEQGPLCSGQGVTVDIAFPGAGRHHCVLAPDGSVVVSVDHEPAVVEGINPSPWYALRFTSDKAGPRTVTLDYTDYEHRYAPYLSTDGKTWAQVPADRVTLNKRKSRATLKLDLPKGPVFLAGQPMSTSTEALNWTRDFLKGHGFTEARYGTSLQGRPLVGFVGGSRDAGADTIVAMTRQHPPETTGEQAFRGFLDRLFGRDDEKAKAFRASHRIILAPMPNPDGVDAGNWRLNGGGVDLNRDWGPFTQPETRALSSWILDQSKGRRVVSMMDFHSTFKTTIYAPPLTAPSPTIGFLPALEQHFKDELKAAPEWSYGHNVNGGTSKGWALEALHAPGVTVELWDQIPTEDARALGAAAADAMIDYFDG
jgi:hypothetical protein